MKKLGVIPGQVIDIYNITLNKATFVKLKFRDGSFGNLSNPRAMYAFPFYSNIALRQN